MLIFRKKIPDIENLFVYLQRNSKELSYAD